MLLLPLLPFLMFEDPSLKPSEGEAVVFRVPAEKSAPPLASFEICFDKVKAVSIGTPNQFGSVRVSVTLNGDGARELAEATIPNVRKQAEVVQGDDVFLNAIINEPLTSGSFELSGVETIARAEQLRQALLGRCTNAKDETE